MVECGAAGDAALQSEMEITSMATQLHLCDFSVICLRVLTLCFLFEYFL